MIIIAGIHYFPEYKYRLSYGTSNPGKMVTPWFSEKHKQWYWGDTKISLREMAERCHMDPMEEVILRLTYGE